MLTPKQRVSIIVGISLLAAFLFLFLLIRLFSDKKEPSESLTSIVSSTETPSSPTISDKMREEEQKTRNQTAGMNALAKLFTERLGSYSNEANFQNIRDVIPLMSFAYAAKTEVELSQKTPPKDFYAVTTRVVSVDTLLQNDTDGTAKVKLTTQRTEELSPNQPSVTKYQVLELTFVKESGVWKVDSANWQ